MAPPARDQQGHERELRRIGLQHGRQQVTFHVMHAQHGHTQGKSEGMSHRASDHERTDQTRPRCVGNSLYIRAVLACA